MKYVIHIYKTWKHFGKILKNTSIGRSEAARYISQHITNYLYKHSKTRVTSVFGHKMYLDDKDSLSLSFNGIYEPYETEVVKSIIHPGNTVLDIGANIGYYTLVFAEAVGRHGKVFAFEPDPTNYELLVKNVRVNNFTNVILERKAVSNKIEKTMLYLSNDNRGMHRIYKSVHTDQSIEIETTTIDDYFCNHNIEIDFIKIDTEGSECAVIEGMIFLLKNNKHLKILVEFHPPSIIEFGRKPQEIIDLLESHGFDIFLLDRKTRTKEAIRSSDLSHIIELSSRTTTNLLCTRN